AGRPAAESRGAGTGGQVSRGGGQVSRGGGRGRRPMGGNDEHVDEMNGQENDQGMGANGGIKGVNGNVEGVNRGARGAPDFSTIIAQQMQNLLPTILAQVGNQGNVGSQNGNVVNENIQENVRNVLVNSNRVGCSYKEFLASNPKEYDGKGGAVVLTRWIEKMESVKIERYVYGLASQIRRMVVATKPKIMQKAFLISGALTDEAVRNGSIKKVEKRRNMGEPNKDKNGRDVSKRTRTRNAFATTANPVGRENMGAWPKCATYNSYHAPGGPSQGIRGNPPNQVVANNESQGRRNQGNQAKGRAFMLGAEEARQDPNIVTGIEPSELYFRYEIEIASWSSSKLSRDQTCNPTSFTNPTPKGRIRRSSKQKVENSNFEENPLPPEIPMAENQTMAQLLQAPTDGYEDAIVLPEIAATNFELKHAWDRFNDLLRACSHHGFSELHQLDTFYNALNVNDQDSLNSAAGGNFLDKMPADCLKIIESKSKVCQTRAKAVVAKVNSNSSTPAVSSDVAELKDMVRALLLEKKNQYSAPTPSPTHAPIKAVEPNCVTCGGTHAYQNCLATSGNVYQDNIQEYASQAAAANYGQGNTGFQSHMVANQIRPPEYQPVQNTQNNFNWGNNLNQNRGGNFNQSNFNQSQLHRPQPVAAPVSTPMPNLKPSIPYPSRRNNERHRDQANEQIEKFYEIFKDMSFEISFTDALMLMPKFTSTLKALIGNKEKLSEMARTLMNEHCSTVILNKLSKKLEDPGKFLIPCEFPGMDECLALADLGASINLMPLFVRKGLSLPELTLTCMTLELADRTETKPIGIAKDVKVKVGVFHFPHDFVVVDNEPDPRVPLILGSPTPSDDPIISTTSPTLTPFGDSDFLLFEEADAFLGLEDDPDSPELDPSYYDPEGDILLLEAILNSDPSPPLLNHEQSVPSFKEELKACEGKTIKSSIDEPPEVELKDLPPHLEYAFLEGDNKLPAIIAKKLGAEEKSALIKVLKSHKRAIAWKLSDIQGINLEFCTHKILMEEDYKPAVQHQRQFNPKIHNVIKKRCMLAIFHDMVEKTMEVFMDDFSVFGNSFENFLSRLDKMLQRCEDTKLCLNWEKSHFMVKEGIVLGYKISKNEIEVDKAKIDVIAKLPPPTTVKGCQGEIALLGSAPPRV
nr:reverse transcriptase domain-containing protein [Tanacetum cinerariifolium]